jgi:hypothetical protein
MIIGANGNFADLDTPNLSVPDPPHPSALPHPPTAGAVVEIDERDVLLSHGVPRE